MDAMMMGEEDRVGKRMDKRQVTFVLPAAGGGGGGGHCSGVNAICLSGASPGHAMGDEEMYTPDVQDSDGGGGGNWARVWTASRDSLVKEWKGRYSGQRYDGNSCSVGVHKSDMQIHASFGLEHKYEGHIDWVNDVVKIGGPSTQEDTLVSCSSDRTIRVWHMHGMDAGHNDHQGHDIDKPSGCLMGHKDYVMSLCHADKSGKANVFSGGLLGQLFLWDLEYEKAAHEFQHIDSSIYAIACDSFGRMVVAGTSSGNMYVVDPRSGNVDIKLLGHTESVRAVMMAYDGSMLMSGGSDHTARLWDMRQRRALHTMAMHTDSLWAMDSCSRTLDVVYTGGRDGCVYKTNTKTMSCELMVHESSPVTCLAVDGEYHCLEGEAGAIWVGTTDSSVRCYSCIDGDDVKEPLSPSSHRFSVGSVPSLRSRMKFKSTGEAHPRAKIETPHVELRGVPAVLEAVPLTDKRHLLTKSSDGTVQLWDITKAAPVEDLGVRDIKDVEREMFDPTQSALTWFQPDCSLGVLAGRMNPSSCFACEAYVKHISNPDAPPDEKLNMAEQLLKELFSTWRQGYDHREHEKHDGEEEDTFMIDAEDGAPSSPVSGAKFRFTKESSPAIMVSGDSVSIPWKKRSIDMDGTEDVPSWVADCVLHSKYPVSKQMKMSFILSPRRGSSLPAMLQSKLNAPRVLEVEKIVDYVLKKISEKGYELNKEPLYWSSGRVDASSDAHVLPQQETQNATLNETGKGVLKSVVGAMKGMKGSGGSESSSVILLTCDDMAIPWDFTLAAVRQWMWKKPEDLKIEYSIRNFADELKLPRIRIPK